MYRLRSWDPARPVTQKAPAGAAGNPARARAAARYRARRAILSSMVDDRLVQLGRLLILGGIVARRDPARSPGLGCLFGSITLIAGVGDLDQLDLFVAHLQVAPAGNAARQKGGVGAAQHLAALARCFDAQADAKLDVRAHLIGDAAGPLRRQNQRDALRPADTGDTFQLGLILGPVGDHLGKLIDDDEQKRIGLVGEVQPLLAIIDDVLGAGFGIERLAALHFRPDRGEHARHAIAAGW